MRLEDEAKGRQRLTDLAVTWLPLLGWMGILFFVSSIPGSSLPRSLSNDDGLRHVGHALGFAVLGLLAYRAVSRSLRRQPKGGRWALVAPLLAFLLGVGYALLDEIYQGIVPGRAFSLLDIGIDVASVAVPLLALVWARHAISVRSLR